MKVANKLGVITLMATESIARMYGKNPDGSSQLEGATRRVLRWSLAGLSTLVKVTPTFSTNFKIPVAKSLDDVIQLIKE